MPLPSLFVPSLFAIFVRAIGRRRRVGAAGPIRAGAILRATLGAVAVFRCQALRLFAFGRA
jgi:hypothetical protein